MLKRLCAVRLRLLLDAIIGGGRRRRSRGMAVVYAALLVYLAVALGGMFTLGFSALLPLADMGRYCGGSAGGGRYYPDGPEPAV